MQQQHELLQFLCCLKPYETASSGFDNGGQHSLCCNSNREILNTHNIVFFKFSIKRQFLILVIGNYIEMNLNFIFYGFFLVTQCYGMDSWGPLNHELSPFASHNQADHQIRRAVPAEERLTLIKDKMAQNNEFTKDTVVPELSGYYERDLAFIFQEIQCHSNAWFITQQLCQMDQWVKGEFGTENLSHAQYAYFGYMWASLLSKYTFQELEEARLYGKYYLNKTWFMHACNQSMDDFQGIPLLHVSKVGLTPVSVLNEGLGFYDSFGKPQMALFFGVATNESVSFDDFEDETSVKLFYHDIRHVNYAFFY